MKAGGIVAAGHPVTADVAADVLRAGGNAFDAAVAGFFAACVAEPVLTSPGGGGFLLAAPVDGPPRMLDFFVQTPRQRGERDRDFRPILADFGTAQQEFHIGLASIAVPGAVAGIFEIHRRFCTMSMGELAEPAVETAKRGVPLNALQAYIFQVVAPIYLATAEARRIFAGDTNATGMPGEGAVLRFPELADFVEILALEGEDLFYRGEVARIIVDNCDSGGGLLQAGDLAAYEVSWRDPLAVDYRGRNLWTNPTPASGGVLTAFALKLLEAVPGRVPWGSAAHLERLTGAMALVNQVRDDLKDAEQAEAAMAALLGPRVLARYRTQLQAHAPAPRGTTHISIMDNEGNGAALSVSNGEGCGSIVPGTGIMLNNMLGESDLNPLGFFTWERDRRMTSMMAPTMIRNAEGDSVIMGSGGSNRIRSAITQVIMNLVDYKMDLESAVLSPRIHVENGRLDMEPGLLETETAPFLGRFAEHKLWPDRNLFFGGIHAVGRVRGDWQGMGDPRRGGECRRVP